MNFPFVAAIFLPSLKADLSVVLIFNISPELFISLKQFSNPCTRF